MYFGFGRSKKFENAYLLNFKTDELTDDMSHGVHMNDVVGENVQKFDILYINADGKFYKADASNPDKFPALAMATEDIEADAEGRLLLSGYIRSDAELNLDPGKSIYLDGEGLFTQDVPQLNKTKQVVGYCLSEHIIFFNPDLTYDFRRIVFLTPGAPDAIIDIPREHGVEYFVECSEDITIRLFQPSEDEVGYLLSFVKLGGGKLTILSSSEIYLASDILDSRLVNDTFERYAVVSLKVAAPDRYIINNFDGTWGVWGPDES